MFEWKPEYSVKIPTIDAQHQRLFNLAAGLHTAMSQGKGTAVLEQALARLVDYTREHFSAEERLMRSYKYPGFDAHKQEHDKLTAQVLDFQERFRLKQAVLTIDLMAFLQDWLQHHISASDQRYASHIRGKIAA